MKTKHKFRLFLKFILIISFCLITILSFLGFLIINQQKTSIIRDKMQSNEIVTRLFASLCSGPIERSSYFILEENAKKIQGGSFDENEILAVHVFDENDIIINPSAKEKEKIEIPKQYWDVQTQPIKSSNKNKNIGEVEIIFSLMDVYEKINRIRISFIAIVIITILILDFIIALLFSLMITKPLKKLTLAAESLSIDNFDIKLDIKTNDEIGFLSEAFKIMSDKLKKKFEEIEEEVEKRTKELQVANRELKIKSDQIIEELDMARKVQLSMIPTANQFPKRNELNFGSKYLSMSSVGGDLYDVIRVGKNGYGFLMVDVSGHGVPAALITSMAKISFNTYSLWGVKTGDVCDKVNKEICKLIGDLGHFFTAYYGILNVEDGRFEYTNAGHHPAIMMNPKTGTIQSLDTNGFFIGTFEDIVYETKSLILEEGNKLLLFTDGLIEASNKKGERYKYDRMLAYIKKNIHQKPKDFVNGLIEDIETFCEGNAQDDDRAILLVEFVSKLNSKQDPSNA